MLGLVTIVSVGCVNLDRAALPEALSFMSHRVIKTPRDGGNDNRAKVKKDQGSRQWVTRRHSGVVAAYPLYPQ
jgi:hypothetical protein